MYELASNIGSAWVLCSFAALAAGLAAIALASGIARIKRNSMPKHFPGDSEALLGKYAHSFNQLEQAAKDNATTLGALADKVKNQPAAHLCLTAYARATGADLALPQEKPAPVLNEGAPAKIVPPAGGFVFDDDDFPDTVEVAIPKKPEGT
jgi:hypothetical protein